MRDTATPRQVAQLANIDLGAGAYTGIHPNTVRAMARRGWITVSQHRVRGRVAYKALITIDGLNAMARGIDLDEVAQRELAAIDVVRGVQRHIDTVKRRRDQAIEDCRYTDRLFDDTRDDLDRLNDRLNEALRPLVDVARDRIRATGRSIYAHGAHEEVVAYLDAVQAGPVDASISAVA